jgi:hypothetical protein
MPWTEITREQCRREGLRYLRPGEVLLAQAGWLIGQLSGFPSPRALATLPRAGKSNRRRLLSRRHRGAFRDHGRRHRQAMSGSPAHRHREVGAREPDAPSLRLLQKASGARRRVEGLPYGFSRERRCAATRKRQYGTLSVSFPGPAAETLEPLLQQCALDHAKYCQAAVPEE